MVNTSVGDEKPDLLKLTLDNPDYQTIYRNALNWANDNLKHRDLKEEALKYASEAMNLDKEILSSLEDWSFNGSISKIAWLYNNQAELDPESKKYLEEKINLLYEQAKKKQSNKTSTNQKTKSQKEQINIFYCRNEVDDIIFEDTLWKNNSGLQKDKSLVYKTLQKYNLKKYQAEEILKHLRELLEEYNLIGKDPDITEAYEELSKQYISESKKWIQEATKQVNSYISNTSVGNKDRKGRTKRVKNQIEELNYKPQDDDYQLKSVDPAKILGKKALLFFNTKSRKVGIYYAKDDNGFSVKGTTLQNVDTEKSIMKTLRKPQKQLILFQNVNLKRVEKLIKEQINGKELSPSPRFNNETVILNVYS